MCAVALPCGLVITNIHVIPVYTAYYETSNSWYIVMYMYIDYSGQMISGPPRKKKDLAKEVFEAAKQLVLYIHFIALNECS